MCLLGAGIGQSDSSALDWSDGKITFVLKSKKRKKKKSNLYENLLGL